jgi:glycosyltransferase involved in cell wall biosynthesis
MAGELLVSTTRGKGKKKILIIANSLEAFGGGERYVFEAASRLQKSYQITVINPKSPKDTVRIRLGELVSRYKMGGVRILDMDCFGIDGKKIGIGNFVVELPKIGSWHKLRKALSSADVVYAVSMNPVLFFYSLFLAKIYRKRLILGLHNPLILREEAAGRFGPDKIIQFFILKTVDEIHAQTETQLRMLRLANYKHKVYYIPHFLYLDSIRKGRDIDRGGFRVLFVGRMEIYQKGLDLLDKIITTTLKIDTSIKFSLVGSGSEGREIVSALESRYPKNVEWHKFVSDRELKRQYQRAGLFIMPSRYETPGLTLLEAQGYGVPAVAFNVQGPRDIMKREVQGKLIPPFDTERFSEAIVGYHRMFEKEQKKYLGLSNPIKKEIERRYSVQKFLGEFGKMIDGA